MANWSIKVEGDVYEDKFHFKLYSNALEIYSLLIDVQQKVRSRWKYHELSDDESKFIDDIYNDLCRLDEIIG